MMDTYEVELASESDYSRGVALFLAHPHAYERVPLRKCRGLKRNKKPTLSEWVKKWEDQLSDTARSEIAEILNAHGRIA